VGDYVFQGLFMVNKNNEMLLNKTKHNLSQFYFSRMVGRSAQDACCMTK